MKTCIYIHVVRADKFLAMQCDPEACRGVCKEAPSHQLLAPHLPHLLWAPHLNYYSATPRDFVPSEKAKRITISGAANIYFSKDLKKKIF